MSDEPRVEVVYEERRSLFEGLRVPVTLDGVATQDSRGSVKSNSNSLVSGVVLRRPSAPTAMRMMSFQWPQLGSENEGRMKVARGVHPPPP